MPIILPCAYSLTFPVPSSLHRVQSPFTHHFSPSIFNLFPISIMQCICHFGRGILFVREKVSLSNLSVFIAVRALENILHAIVLCWFDHLCISCSFLKKSKRGINISKSGVCKFIPRLLRHLEMNDPPRSRSTFDENRLVLITNLIIVDVQHLHLAWKFLIYKYFSDSVSSGRKVSSFFHALRIGYSWSIYVRFCLET